MDRLVLEGQQLLAENRKLWKENQVLNDENQQVRDRIESLERNVSVTFWLLEIELTHPLSF